MSDVQRSLGELHAKVDILLARGTDHDKRIRSLEAKQWWQSGASAVAGAIAAWWGKAHFGSIIAAGLSLAVAMSSAAT